MHGRLRARPGAVGLDGIPVDFNGKLLAPDWLAFEPIMEGAIRRVPDGRCGVNRVINGPEAFTPDNESILGESDVRGFWLAAGFLAHGIAGAGGIGRQMASWIVDGEPELDLWKMDIRRFGTAYRRRRTACAIDRELRHLLRHPLSERGTPGRPAAAHSPTYDDLAELGAVFGEKSGWERRIVRAQRRRPAIRRARPPRAPPSARLGRPSTGRRRSPPRRWPPAGQPACSTRRRSRSSRSSGAGSCAFLQRVCGNDIDRADGPSSTRSCSTGAAGSARPWTVTRLASDRFMLITGMAYGQHDLGWLRSQLTDDELVDAERDLVAGVVSVCGATRARDILASTPRGPVGHRIPVPDGPRDEHGPGAGGVALRVTYVGELGWELYAPMEFGRTLWRRSARRGSHTGWSPAATGRSTPCASRRLPRLVERHHARRDAVRGRPGVRRGSRQGPAVDGRDALVTARPTPEQASALPSPSTTRSMSASNGKSGEVDGRIVGRGDERGPGLCRRGDRVAYAYLPDDAARTWHARSRYSVAGSASRSPGAATTRPTKRIRA